MRPTRLIGRPSAQPTGLIGSASPRPSLVYRALRALCRLTGRSLFRISIDGVQNLPRGADGRHVGGWICCALPHRNWIEPFTLLAMLPVEPRLVVLGDGPTMFRSWWRRLLVRRVGGVVPIWPGSGPSGFQAHVAAAKDAVAAGSIFVHLPEVGRAARAPQLRRLSSGMAYLAIRTGAPVVPIVFGGTHEPYLRRRIVMRVLPALDVRGLAGTPSGNPAPDPGSDAERLAAGRVMAAFAAIVRPAVIEAHNAAEMAPVTVKRWRWLSGTYPRAE